MRFQACIFLKNGSQRSKVVRAKSTDEALTELMATEDLAFAPRGYAHPLRLARPERRHWRWNLYCSVNGKVTMSNQGPSEQMLITQILQ